VAFSPLGDALATAARYVPLFADTSEPAEGAVKLWDSATRKELLEIGSGVVAAAVAFSPDGTLVATADADNRACIWDAAKANGQPLRQLSHDGAVTAVAFNADGTQLATASADNTARIWDMAGL
jgi:WD40 repeat protein